MNTYNLHEGEYKTEGNIIQNIMYNNAFPIQPHIPPTSEPHRKIATTTHTPTHKSERNKFHYKPVQKDQLKNCISNQQYYPEFTKAQTTATDIYTQSGVYKLKCPDCNKAYVGQTGRSFQVRFNEDKNAFKTNSHTSNFAKHLNELAHSFGSIHTTMQILQRQNKGSHLNTIERFYTYAEYLNNNHLKDEHTIFPNIILEALLKPH